jgi:toxin YhaV
LPGKSSRVINGWTIYAHPLFLDQIEKLSEDVERLYQKDPVNYVNKNLTKELTAIRRLVLEEIPQDPTDVKYRLGSSLGDDYKHWFRAKFFQQYRLFFRFHKGQKIIVYSWVNDDGTKRAYASKTDAYRVFKKMLDNGHPPDDWDTLIKEAEEAAERLNRALDGPAVKS